MKEWFKKWGGLKKWLKLRGGHKKVNFSAVLRSSTRLHTVLTKSNVIRNVVWFGAGTVCVLLSVHVLLSGAFSSSICGFHG